MDYKFNKVSLEQAPDIAVDLVTDAVCGYLKKINNVDTLKDDVSDVNTDKLNGFSR